MKSVAEILLLADARSEEAELLYSNDRLEVAFYLGGYVLELQLKAKISSLLKIDDFYETVAPKSDFSKVYLIHNLEKLLLLAGLSQDLDAEKASNQALSRAWLNVGHWNEKSRYAPLGTFDKIMVREFLDAVHFLSVWIQQH